MERKQIIWRTLSDLGHSGYLVYEIYETMGMIHDTHNLTKCQDGSYIYTVMPYYVSTKREAIEVLFHNDDTEFCEIYVISGKPELTTAEYREFLELED